MATVQPVDAWQVAPVTRQGLGKTSSKQKVNGRQQGQATEALPGFLLDFRPVIDMTDDEFFIFCQTNHDLRIERNANGEIWIMPLTAWETGAKNALITSELTHWARRDKTGVATDSSSGYKLPNGATRAPDAAWVRKTRLTDIPKEQRQKFLPLCPDFVIELRSPSDGLRAIQDKMREYITNGAQLGWLIDPPNYSVYIYRPEVEVEHLHNITEISGEPLLPGFVLELSDLWENEI